MSIEHQGHSSHLHVWLMAYAVCDKEHKNCWKYVTWHNAALSSKRQSIHGLTHSQAAESMMWHYK